MIQPETVVQGCWLALGLYWLVGSFRTKPVAVNENRRSRLFRLLLFWPAMFVLLGTDWLRIGPLGQRFAPLNSAITWLGVALTAAGVAVAIWARWHLGRNWSDKVVLKVDHQLIQTGPYRYLRHPIYSGIFLAVAGTVLTVGEWRAVIALILIGAIYYVKATREEKILASNFGEAFAEHKRRTGFFLPGL